MARRQRSMQGGWASTRALRRLGAGALRVCAVAHAAARIALPQLLHALYAPPTPSSQARDQLVRPFTLPLDGLHNALSRAARGARPLHPAPPPPFSTLLMWSSADSPTAPSDPDNSDFGMLFYPSPADGCFRALFWDKASQTCVDHPLPEDYQPGVCYGGEG